MSYKATIPRGRQRRNEHRDVCSMRYPMGRTYRGSSTLNPSRVQNKHDAGVKLHAWGENPPTCTCKRGRAVNRRNNLHIWLNRRADGLTRRYCGYEPGIPRKAAPCRSYTPAGRTSSVSHLQARENGDGRLSRRTCGRWERDC